MTAVLELIHTPQLPSFECTSCGEPWPCAPVKVELAEQFQDDIDGLGQYLGAHMADALDQAAADARWGRVDNLFDRFLGWMPKGKGAQRAA